ncbi:MAG: hypothetical protein IKW83_12185 [Muribaculaceae bacterium]|nr:hypothetical protein [Muribaculaceae bacterium]
MRTTCYNLPGICEVRFIAVAHLLPYLVEKVAAGAPIAVERDKTQMVNVWGNPTCTADAKDSNNGRAETVTLEFATLSKVPAVGTAFLVKQASGQWCLIGSRETAPVVSINYNTGEMAGEASVYRVSVQFTAYKALLPVAL